MICRTHGLSTALYLGPLAQGVRHGSVYQLTSTEKCCSQNQGMCLPLAGLVLERCADSGIEYRGVHWDWNPTKHKKRCASESIFFSHVMSNKLVGQTEITFIKKYVHQYLNLCDIA